MKKGKYRIPIIIENSIGNTKYIIKVVKDMYNLKANTFYKCHYRITKFVKDDIWNIIKYLNSFISLKYLIILLLNILKII